MVLVLPRWPYMQGVLPVDGLLHALISQSGRLSTEPKLANVVFVVDAERTAALLGTACWLANTASSCGMYFLARSHKDFFRHGWPRRLLGYSIQGPTRRGLPTMRQDTASTCACASAASRY